MHSLSKRGQTMAFATVITLILGIIFLVVSFGITASARGTVLNVETLSETGCWLSNTLKCGEGAFAFFPSMCYINYIEEPIGGDEPEEAYEELASMLRDTWYMFKRGECDFSNEVDGTFQTYAFEVKNDVDLEEFLIYLTKNNRGKQLPKGKTKKSDWNYLETGSKANTLCFDTHDKEGIANNKLVPGELYYIIYYDDAMILETDLLHEKSDSIIISTNAFADKNYWAQLTATGVKTYLSFNPLTSATGVADVAHDTIYEGDGCLVYKAP